MKKITKDCLSILSLSLSLLATSFAPAMAGVESDETLAKASKALNLQQYLDHDLPLSQSYWPGAHNAYAASDWGYVNANQKYRPERLLNHGIREMSLDIYPALDGFEYKPYLCHNSLEEDAYCTTGNKSLAEGLREVRSFLSNEDNQQAVIMLKLETFQNNLDNGHLRRVREKIEDVLGDRVYKPKDFAFTSYGQTCGSLPVASITKNDILADGKNVIIVLTSKDHTCTYYKDGNFHQWVWYGLDEYDPGSGNNTKKSQKFVGVQNLADCNNTDADKKAYSMLRGADAITVDSGGSASLRTETMADLMACGLNVAEAGLIGHSDGKIETKDFVWSWNHGEPNDANGNEDCAEIYGNLRKFNDARCTNVQKFICRTAGGNFAISSTAGSWSQGPVACSNIGAEFTVPKTAVEMRAITDLMVQVGTNKVWANYHDQSVEGLWQINDPVVKPVTTIAVPPEGGPGGGDFTSRNIIRSYISGAINRLSSVTIHAGARVDALQLGYDNGTQQWIGDIGGVPNTLALQNGEYITGYETCYHKSSSVSSRRLYYLRLSTSSGRTIEGGQQLGTCRADTFTDKALLGFHGRKGQDPDALGFYLVNTPGISQTLQVGLINGGGNGKYMAAELGGGSNVVVNRSQKASWETFRIHYARDNNNNSNSCLGHNQLVKVQTVNGHWLTASASNNVEALATSSESATTFEVNKFQFFHDPVDGECIAPGTTVLLKAVDSNRYISQRLDNAVTVEGTGTISGQELFNLTN